MTLIIKLLNTCIYILQSVCRESWFPFSDNAKYNCITFHVFMLIVCLGLIFVCLFVFGWSSHSRIIHSYLDVTINRWIAAKFKLSSALTAIETLRVRYSVTPTMTLDIPFIMVISEDPWHSHLLPNVKHWSCH